MFIKTKKNQIVNLRAKIDQFDGQIVKLIAQRFNVAKKIGMIKKINKMKIADNKRELDVIFELSNLATNLNINSKFIKHIYKLIINESKRMQNEK